MSNIAIKGAATGSGTFTLEAPATSTNRTLTLPDEAGTVVSTGSTAIVTQTMLAAGVAGNGPSFYARKGAAQTLTTSSYTKLQMDTEVFDTNSNYDNATNFRFTPTVAGYYFVNIQVFWIGNVVSPSNAVYKNGAVYSSRYDQGTFANLMQGVTALVYLNGTTDYIENYAQISSGSTGIYTGTNSFFQAFLARAA